MWPKELNAQQKLVLLMGLQPRCGKQSKMSCLDVATVRYITCKMDEDARNETDIVKGMLQYIQACRLEHCEIITVSLECGIMFLNAMPIHQNGKDKIERYRFRKADEHMIFTFSKCDRDKQDEYETVQMQASVAIILIAVYTTFEQFHLRCAELVENIPDLHREWKVYHVGEYAQ